ncbi:response regulator [Sediminibacillus dalangtanensis]|uniref:Response regulator n=1 Tax=Sediminibacillus dalangtanensis TaxID=2729421 RepID=A0ABX7VWT0_9BACI|nr:response regulator transcription factor [Sediminibacillus dalangtanensis]QTM99056.1 response regulator [Sediminibacillus dalangtanensis]
MEKPTLLIVDDEMQMRMLLKVHLNNTFHLFEADNGEDALQLLKNQKIDLVLLDIMMPQLDGLEVCKRIRAKDQNIPIILLTALNETKDKVEGLNLGADDYIVKPFEPEELEARIKAQLRRTFDHREPSNDLTKRMQELTIYPKAREAYVKETLLKLTPKEFDLLYLLTSNPKWVYTREQLLDLVWGIDEIIDIRTVDSHVRNLRDKLKVAGLTYQPIKTIWGVGYKFTNGESI